MERRIFTNARTIGVMCGLMAIFFAAIAYLTGELVYRSLYVILGMSAFLVVAISSKSYSTLVVSSAVFVALLTSSLLNIESSGWRSLFGAFLFLASFGIGWAALEFRATRVLLELPFLFAITVIAILDVFFGYGHREFNHLLEGSSRNVLSAILVMLGVGYLFSKWYRGCAPSLFPLFVLLFVSVSLYGRSGIVFSVAITILAACARFGARRLFLIFLMLVPLSGLFYGCFGEVFVESTNFRHGFESARFLMFIDYFSSLDVVGLFFGRDLWEVSVIADYGGNPHNAFLRLHAYHGLVVMLFVVMVLSGFLLHLVNGRWFLASLVIVVMARAFFDIVVFFNLIDFAVFPLIFYSFYFARFRSCNLV